MWLVNWLVLKLGIGSRRVVILWGKSYVISSLCWPRAHIPSHFFRGLERVLLFFFFGLVDSMEKQTEIKDRQVICWPLSTRFPKIIKILWINYICRIEYINGNSCRITKINQGWKFNIAVLHIVLFARSKTKKHWKILYAALSLKIVHFLWSQVLV